MDYEEKNGSSRITIGLGENLGKILYYSETSPHFFQYTESDFTHILEVNELMPYPIKEYHNSIIQHYIDSDS